MLTMLWTNSLHPVLRYYSVPPDGFIKLKKPTKTLHIPEDFIVEWEDRKTECPEVRHDSVFVRLRSRASNERGVNSAWSVERMKLATRTCTYSLSP